MKLVSVFDKGGVIWSYPNLSVEHKKVLTFLSSTYILRTTIHRSTIYRSTMLGANVMDKKLKRVYIPMTETGFYILYCLQEEMHGYNIGQKVKKMTGGEIDISAGTMYGSLSKMEKDGLIRLVREVEKRKIYVITELGREILDIELKRIERLYKNSKGVILDE